MKFQGLIVCTIVHVVFSIATDADNIVDEEPKTKYTVLEHENLSVYCNATETDDIEIYWTRHEKHSDFFHEGTNLTFTNITRMDAGDYECHALNTTIPGVNETSYNYTVEIVKIIVQYAAEIAGFDLGPDTVFENETYLIDCNFMGVPGPNWEIRNDHTKQSFGQALHLAANVTIGPVPAVCGDTGRIVCTGYNELNHGENVTQGKNLTVFCSPRPNPEAQTPNTTTGVIGSSVFLFVNVIGYPYPSYSWSRVDDKPMPEYTQIDFPSVTALNITNTKLEDYGIYAVTMNNSIGSHTTTLELKAYGHPEPPYNLTYSNLTYNSVSLSWVSGYDMGSKQHFIVMEEIGDGSFIQTYDAIYGDYTNHGLNTSWQTTLYGLYGDTQYTLTILAANEFGLTTLAKTKVSFTTYVDPHIRRHHKHHIGLIVGSVAGGIVFVGFLAFLVYMLKYRKMRDSYEKMPEKNKS